MRFQKVNRSDPERVFIVMEANETVAADDCVQLELNSASINGVRIRQPDTGNLWAFVGVADTAITSGNYGLIQVHGYRGTSRVFATDTSIDTGFPLVPTAGAVYFQTFNSTLALNVTVTHQPAFAVLCESVTDLSASATASKKVFIRAM